MATHDIVVIGASAGGVGALSIIVSALPAELRAAVRMVLHIPRAGSVLPAILTRAGQLQAVHPADGEALEYGRIYVAPPDRHMTVDGDVIRISEGPSENGVRPAVDPLFRSAARFYGSRVIGIIVTGALADGTAGMLSVKQAGGITIVQDPKEASAASMPRSVMASVPVDYVLPIHEIAPMIVTLVGDDGGSAGDQSGDGDSSSAAAGESSRRIQHRRLS